jgi:hypothetical protein
MREVLSKFILAGLGERVEKLVRGSNSLRMQNVVGERKRYGVGRGEKCSGGLWRRRQTQGPSTAFGWRLTPLRMTTFLGAALGAALAFGAGITMNEKCREEKDANSERP